jgi:serine/threonine protein kinase
MLMLDPNRRITADEALCHDYFKVDPLPATNEEIAAILNIK